MIVNWTLLSTFILVFILLLTVPIIIAALINNQSEKTSLFECGLSNCDSPRHPFSLRFFLLIILFIIFDSEITVYSCIVLYISANVINFSLTYINEENENIDSIT